jgi:hypothetical protein
MTVAHVANAGLGEKAVIDYAIKTQSEGGTVKVNIPHRMYQVCGRQLTLEGANGSRAMVAMFDFMGRLYQIEAKVPPGGNEFELTRFQQSLVFERGVSDPRRRKSVPFAPLVPRTPPVRTIRAVKHGDECRFGAPILKATDCSASASQPVPGSRRGGTAMKKATQTRCLQVFAGACRRVTGLGRKYDRRADSEQVDF